MLLKADYAQHCWQQSPFPCSLYPLGTLWSSRRRINFLIFRQPIAAWASPELSFEKVSANGAKYSEISREFNPANVHVSMIGFDNGAEKSLTLDGRQTEDPQKDFACEV